MSLFRRLWLVVICTTALAFVGSFVVSVLTARNYLEQQLYTQSMDNAASLALSMTQQGKDPATSELLVSALFDSGHFRLVRYSDVQGRTVVERQNLTATDNVPFWFSRLFPIHARPGEALVSDGWQQAGRVTILADARFAYAALWSGTLRLLAWIAGAGLLTGLLGSLLLRAIRRPLDRVVEQADAITERRFISVAVPKIPELKTMVMALNSMVERLKAMFAEEAARILALQQEVNGDAVTGLANKSWFDSRLAAALHDEDAAGEGCVLWLHLHELQNLNLTLGHEGCDKLLREIAGLWRAPLASHHDWVAARPVGGEFMLLAPRLDQLEATVMAEQVMAQIVTHLDTTYQIRGNVAHLGIAAYRHGETPSHVRQQADRALLSAIEQGDNTVCLQDVAGPDLDEMPWQTLLARGLAERCFFLQAFPVITADGAPLHEEMALRLRHPDTGLALSAGSFMPFATRLGITPALDLEASRQALAMVQQQARPLAINLSIESAQSINFLELLVKELSAHPEHAKMLWFEVSEHGLTGELRILKQLTDSLRPLGCHIGIDHFGRHFSSLPHLHALGLDYLKIDSSLIAGLDSNTGNQAVVRAIASIADNLGLITIAERVQTVAERDTLKELGVSGLTGPVVGQAS